MGRLKISSPSEQVADHLRGGLMQGMWSREMPGAPWLATELGVDRKTVEAGLCLLEQDGLLMPQGPGRRRKIVLSDVRTERHPLRVAILLSDAADRRLDYIVALQHALADAGCPAFFAPKVLSDLGMEVGRIARMVERTEADAWVVMAASREMLEWFAGQAVPAFALFGRRDGLALAATGPDKPQAMVAATRALLELGHRRIVLLARSRRRLPEPGASERAFLAELEAHGVVPGAYHLPDWEDSGEGLHQRLHSLFQLTPPTALILDETHVFTATYHFLAGRRLRVPDKVSLVCTDASPDFEWCRPTVAHIRWDGGPLVRRIVRWAENVSRGKRDLRQTLTPAEFVPGGTMGVAVREKVNIEHRTSNIEHRREEEEKPPAEEG